MEIRIGKVIHYYNRINVAVLLLTDEIKIGDTVHFLGHSTDFTQKVTSMEIEHQKVQVVGAGEEVAAKVNNEVRRGDQVYKVTAE